MASFAVPCPKVSPPLAASSQPSQKSQLIASFPRSECRLVAPSMLAKIKGLSRSQSNVFKVSAQLNEVAVEKTSVEKELKEAKSQYEIPDAESISVFMDQVSDLIKLVDSRDIVELQLKQLDCELVIRKKEALPQPSTSAPVYYAPPPTPQATYAPQPPTTNAPAPASAGTAPSTPSAPALPAPGKPKSSHPPFKCPMAGSFYRSPAPGAPPFVKVGDKVQKGQVICIIEAMKLMNDIEADQSGTVVEILAEDGKPVSVDTPLFIIEP